MNITLEKSGTAQTQPFPNPPPPSDLLGNPDFERKPHRRRKKAPGAPSVKRSRRPEPPLLKWKFNDCCGEYKSVEKDKSAGEAGRKCRRRTRSVASARNLPAGISRTGLPEFDSNAGRRVGLQEAAKGKKAISKHSQWRNYDDLNEYFCLGGAPDREGLCVGEDEYLRSWYFKVHYPIGDRLYQKSGDYHI
ncbi:hypothetical protein CASFOL_037903 [Castilleja foliolosa]|uniref:Uncharacterized protein n=1 Tax=Castilleja foliolosa TaxID=1961234 RepID=A0ABD3BLG3_9LAMI